MHPQKLPEANEFIGWLDHPVTKAVFEMLRRKRVAYQEQWASGDFEDASQFATAIKGARAIGTCEALKAIMELEFEELIGELSNEK